MNIDLIRQQIANLELRFPQLVEDAEAWALSIDSETDTFDVLRQIERRRQEAASMAGALASNIAEIELRQARFVEREKAMRALALAIMNTAQITKAELPEATLSITKPRERAVILPDYTAHPDYCHPPVYKPDMKKIKEALEGGEKLNWASLVMGEPSISIRTK